MLMTTNVITQREDCRRKVSPALRVELYREVDREDVSAFLLNHSLCHPVQFPAWRRAVIATYRGRDVSLVVRRTDAREHAGIVGFLPLWADDRGRHFVSAPHASVASLLCHQAADPDQIATVVFGRLQGELATQSVRRCVISAVAGDHLPDTAGVDDVRSIYLLDVPRTVEEALAKASSIARNRYRKAIKHGVTIQHGHRQLSVLYDLYIRAMRNKGTPCHPRKLFEALLEEFGDDADVLVVSTKEGRPAAAMLTLRCGGTLFYPWHSSDPSQLSCCPNDFLIWALLERATTLGINTIDMGTSIRDSTQARFKEKWGGREARMHVWDSEFRSGAESGSVAMKVAPVIWRQLPLSWTRFLGPLVRRRIP